MHGVARRAQFVGERAHALGQPLDVVVEQNLCHLRPPRALIQKVGTFDNASLLAPWPTTRPPDYELADRIALTRAAQVKAISHPLRNTILGLLHERAATVTELAVALDRPKSTVAHHVKVLDRTGLVQVVRTRRVRAIEERFYGRTARMFYVASSAGTGGEEMPRDFNDFEVAARESGAAFRDGKLWGFIRHARIAEEQASEFWERMAKLVDEFDRLPGPATPSTASRSASIRPTTQRACPTATANRPRVGGSASWRRTTTTSVLTPGR